jgi:2-polyprenyl-3-methyl-5-hydroxy-6-metoxy-1,4-benzoquinol methylase
MYTSAQKWNEFYQRMEQKATSLMDPATGHVAEHLVQTVACPLCGSSSYQRRAMKHGFTYVTCNGCSFVYVNPQLTQEAIRNVYNDEDLREFFFRNLLLPHVERDQRPEFESRLDKLQKLVQKPNPRLLDIGCAAGLFLSLAGQRGFDAEGLELNDLYVDYIRTHRSVKIYPKLLEEMQYPAGSFEVVTLWDVLEHLPKPANTLTEIARVLRQDGILALTTINHDCINEKILKDRWRYYMPPDHLCSFTPVLLESLLRRCGFTIVRIEYQYMFEVLADHYFRFLTLSQASGFGSATLNKFKKLLTIVLHISLQAVFRTFHSGDLVTVYARKS